ncbi:MAG: ACT domain-containing protein, partial [Desulfobacterales bacterium]
SGKVLEELQPFIKMADRMGRMLSQLSEGHIKSVEIDYDGNFGDYDMSPVRTAVICGLLEPLVLDDVNAVNAPYLAKDKGIKILESSSDDAREFINLLTVTVRTDKGENVVSGTLFGKSDPRIVRINDFRLEMRPEGYLALIHNMDIPGEIGSIGTILGEHNVNIARMTVGQEEPEGERNIVFLRTDTPLSREVLDKLENYPRARQVIYMDL